MTPGLRHSTLLLARIVKHVLSKLDVKKKQKKVKGRVSRDLMADQKIISLPIDQAKLAEYIYLLLVATVHSTLH